MAEFPREVARNLAMCKLDGLPFGLAWRVTMERLGEPPTDERGPWAPLLPYMRRVMLRAYEARPDEKPLSRLEPPDIQAEGVSVAVVAPQGHRPHKRTSQLCVSGDGCAEVATHGRFGSPKFCEAHHAEIHKAMGDQDATEVAMAEHHARMADKRDGAPSSIAGMRGFAGVKPSSRTKGGQIGGAIRGAQLRKDAA